MDNLKAIPASKTGAFASTDETYRRENKVVEQCRQQPASNTEAPVKPNKVKTN